MSYGVYKLIHFLGIFAALTILAGTATHAVVRQPEVSIPSRRAVKWGFGFALFLILLGGFGMLARLGVAHTGLPTWVNLKLLIWASVGGLILAPRRGAGYARFVLVAVPLLAVLAAGVALYKPF